MYATKSWLTKNNIDYIEKDVSANPEIAAELSNLGYKVTPVIMVNGTAIVGYNTNKLAEALKN